MSAFQNKVQLDLRLALLRLLVEAADEGANSFVLAHAAEQLGFHTTRDQVRAELQWLADVRLVSLFDTGGPLVATLTERGGDVARGRAINPGVSPFVPGSGVPGASA